MAKFNEKAIVLYGVTQIAQGLPAKVPSTAVVGSISVPPASTSGSTSYTISGSSVSIANNLIVTGTGTTFLTQATPRAYLFDGSNNIIGQIDKVIDNLTLSLVAPLATSSTATAQGVMGVIGSATTLTTSNFSFGLGPNNALAVLNFNYSDSIATQADSFIGSELDRYEETSVTDIFSQIDFEVLMPVLGPIPSTTTTGTGTITTSGSFIVGTGTAFTSQVLVGDRIIDSSNNVIGVVTVVTDDTNITLSKNATIILSGAGFKIVRANRSPLISEVPLYDWFQAAGLGIVLSSGQVKVTNSLASTTYMTIEVHHSSLDLATLATPTQKVYRLTDAIGTMDITAKVGLKTKLKFNFMGNTSSIEDSFAFVPNYGNQKILFGDVLKSTNVNLSAVTPYVSTVQFSSTIPYITKPSSNLVIDGLTYTTPNYTTGTVTTLGTAGAAVSVGANSITITNSFASATNVIYAILDANNNYIGSALGGAAFTGTAIALYNTAAVAVASGATLKIAQSSYSIIGGISTVATAGQTGINGMSLTNFTGVANQYYVLTDLDNNYIGRFQYRPSTDAVPNPATSGSSLTLFAPAAISYSGKVKVILQSTAVSFAELGSMLDTLVPGVTPTPLTGKGTFSGKLTNYTVSKVSATKINFYSATAYATKYIADFTNNFSATLPFTTSNFTTLAITSIPDDPATSNIAFDSVTAGKINGFDYSRYMTSTEQSWSRMAVPTDISLNILEDIANALYNPYENLETKHKINLSYGSSSSNYQVSLVYEKAQLTKVAPAKIGAYLAQNLTFRNIGNISIIFN